MVCCRSSYEYVSEAALAALLVSLSDVGLGSAYEYVNQATLDALQDSAVKLLDDDEIPFPTLPPPTLLPGDEQQGTSYKVPPAGTIATPIKLLLQEEPSRYVKVRSKVNTPVDEVFDGVGVPTVADELGEDEAFGNVDAADAATTRRVLTVQPTTLGRTGLHI